MPHALALVDQSPVHHPKMSPPSTTRMSWVEFWRGRSIHNITFSLSEVPTKLQTSKQNYFKFSLEYFVKLCFFSLTFLIS
jgi:hypothetical protein